LRYFPAEGKPREVWRLPPWRASKPFQDFDADLMLGISTFHEWEDGLPDTLGAINPRYKLVTEVVDLRSGKVLLTIDDSKQERPDRVSFVFVGIVAIILLVLGVLRYLFRKPVSC
jgi:hypothetical protein